MNLNKTFRQNLSAPLFDKPTQAAGYGSNTMGRPFQKSCGFYGPMSTGRMGGSGDQQGRLEQPDDIGARFHGKLNLLGAVKCLYFMFRMNSSYSCTWH